MKHSCHFGQTHWRSRAQRVWFRLCAVCLSVYTAYAAYLSHSGLFAGPGRTAAALLIFALLSAALFAGLNIACEILRSVNVPGRKQRDGVDLRVFFAAVVLALAVLGCAFAACYPGGVNYDVSNQWRQIHSGEYNNWHPLFHTLLVGLLLRVKDSYPFAVLCQIVLFSLAMGRLTATLHKRGVPGWLALLVHTVAVASWPVRNPLMYLGKDAAMTIGVIVLTTQAVEVLYSRGEWLKKPLHAVSMGLLLGYVTLLRVNALLWTVPFLGCLFFAWKPARKQAALALGVMIALMALVQGPVYGSLDVVYPNNTIEEAVGLPMTILGDVKQREGDKLDEETNAFLNTLASDEAWQTTYQLHTYNSIKFTYPRELIKYTPVGDILGMTLRAAAAAPRTAFEAVNGLTDIVWGLDGKDEGFTPVRNSGDIPEAPRGSGRINHLGEQALKLIDAVMGFAPVRYLTCNIGVQMLLLLLFTLWALRRQHSGVLLLALPGLLYNLGTMLLLCGNDARFFQFFMAVSLPAMLALVYLPTEERGNC